MCWSTSPNPTIADSHTTDGSGTGTFSSNIAGLDPGTHYYVRAYATNSAGTAYGDQQELTSLIQCHISSSANPSGGGTTAGDGAYDHGSAVSMVATATPGYHFVNWTESGTVVSTNATYDFLATADRTLVANFGFQITVYAADGGGTVSGGGTFVAGTPVTVHGSCLYGTHFGAWWDPAVGTVSYDADYTFTATVDRELYGSFGYHVTATANPASGGVAIGVDPEYGYPASVFASPHSGWHFLNWTEGGTVVSTSAFYTFATSSDRALVANFNTTPTLTTAAPTGITATGATSGGTTTSDGGDSVTARGVCWSTSHNPTISDSHTTDGAGTGTFTSTISGCAQDTPYYVRAYATNSAGTAYGNEQSFTTLTTPTVTTTTPTNIGSTTADSGGNVTDDGGGPVAARGVCWSTSPNPTIADDHTDDGTSTGPFTSNMTGLSPGTLYHVRAYATNSVGTSYGTQEDFTTDTTPTVTTTVTTDITSTTADSGGNVTDDGGDPVTARGVCWSTSSNPTAAGDHTSDGTGTGAFTSNITGLDPGTHYYLRAFATNSVGTSYGGQAELTTLQPLSAPKITSVSPDRGPVGTTVTIKGSNFGTRYTSGRGVKYALSSSCCMFNQTECVDYVSWSNTEIKCKVPQGAVPGPVRVFTGKGASNANFTFTPTVPLTPFYFLAEGSTAHGFSTFINIENPTDEDLNCSVNFLMTDGKVHTEMVGLPRNSQTTLNSEDFIGQADFSTRVDCIQGKMIAVDRTMVWQGDNAPSPESHSSIGTTSPQKTWFLAEGSSAWGFETWTVVENPNDKPTKVTLSYMIEGGPVCELEKTIPANARASYSMGDDIGEADASILVTSDLPIVTERSMYRNNRREGSCSIGTPSPGSNFYLAEGTSAWGFTTYVLVQNPNPAPASITLTYMTDKGASRQTPFTMGPNSRETVRVNDTIQNTDFSIQVSADKPVVAERAMYWGSDTPLGEACHTSSGVCSAHETFYLPDGSTQEGMETYTLVENPNSTPVQIELTYLMPAGKDDITFTDTLKPNTRKTYSMADKIPDGRASIQVTSRTKGSGIVVERSMYWKNQGAGTNTIGAYVDSN